MQETLTDIKQMREFYEREKRILEEQQQLKKLKEAELMHNGMNYYGLNNMNTGMSVSPHMGNNESNNIGPWVNNYMIPPNNNNTPPFYIPNFNNTLQNNGMSNQRLEQMNSKQQELEDQLLKLRRENEEILKDKESKQSELFQLKKMIEEIKNQNFTNKVINEENPKNTNNDVNEKKNKIQLESESSKNVLNKPYDRRLSKENQSVSPCSSSHNLDNHKKTNQTSPSPVKKPEENQNNNNILKEMESPEILMKMKNNPKYANKEERNFKLPLNNLKNFEDKSNEIQFMGGITTQDKNEKKEITSKDKEVKFKKIDSMTLINKEPSKNPQISQVKTDVIKTTQKKPDPTNIQNKTELNNSKESVVLSELTKKPSIQKNSIFNGNKVTSSEQINTSNRPGNLRKSDRSNKHARISSIEFITDLSNPGILLKSLVPSFPRNFPIKKQLFLNEMTFSIECRVIDEGDQPFFLLQGKNETTNIVLTDEKLPTQLFSKILQTVDVKDILPYEVPIKTMENYEDFMRYCVMPFLGVFYIFNDFF